MSYGVKIPLYIKDKDMKKVEIKNYQHEKGQFMAANGAEFTVKEIILHSDISTLHANFVEVAPGHFAYGYHWHEMNEEVFYVISGTAAVKLHDREVTLKAGDAITFPTGPEGAHVIRNASDTEKLVYLDIGSEHLPEICHMPGAQKIMVIGKTGVGMYDEETSK